MEAPILSTADVVEFTAPSGRRYTLAPLSMGRRGQYEADVAEKAGFYPNDAALILAVQAAVTKLAPANMGELLACIEAFRANPGDVVAVAEFAALEAQVATVPVYAALKAQRARYMAALPLVEARWGLAGWAAEDLPAFATDARGAVPWEVLDALPEADVRAIGWRCTALNQPDKAAVGNSASPSPSSASPAPAKEGNSPKTGAGGSSRGRSGKATRG